MWNPKPTKEQFLSPNGRYYTGPSKPAPTKTQQIRDQRNTQANYNRAVRQWTETRQWSTGAAVKGAVLRFVGLGGGRPEDFQNGRRL